MDISIPLGASVQCSDSVCGTSTYVVVDPVDDKITHLVIRQSEPPHTQRMVPVEWITQTTSNLIQLRCTEKELGYQRAFMTREYVKLQPPDLPAYIPAPLAMGTYRWPYAIPDGEHYLTLEHESVPPGELAVWRGAHVEATDGGIGRVDEFLVDPVDHHITHMLLREGHLWGQRDVSIPISAIDSIEEDIVHLKLSKDEVEGLPAIPIRG